MSDAYCHDLTRQRKICVISETVNRYANTYIIGQASQNICFVITVCMQFVTEFATFIIGVSQQKILTEMAHKVTVTCVLSGLSEVFLGFTEVLLQQFLCL